MEATLTDGQLAELIHDGRILYVDRWGGPAQTDMDNVRIVGGADYVEGLTGYTGQGVRGEILDTELRMTHQEWDAAPIVHSASSSVGFPPHGTSVTSNVFAEGVNAPARGMLPDGQPIFFLASEASVFGADQPRHGQPRAARPQRALPRGVPDRQRRTASPSTSATPTPG